jgi:hypothetical protein
LIDVYFTGAGRTYEAGDVALEWQTWREGRGRIGRAFYLGGESIAAQFDAVIGRPGMLLLTDGRWVIYDGPATVVAVRYGERQGRMELRSAGRPRRQAPMLSHLDIPQREIDQAREWVESRNRLATRPR